MKKIFNDFYWKCCESDEVFVNNKNEIVGIVDMYSKNPIGYFFMNMIYKRTNEIEVTKDDYIRLYPKKSKNIQFVENKISDNSECTLGFYLK